MLKKTLRIFVAAATLALTSTGAFSHTVSYGYLPGANPGDVDFWFGSYHGNGGNLANIPFESTMNLQGENATVFGPQSFLPTQKSLNLPAGLTLGSNYFCDPTYGSCTADVVSWMGVTATGLNPGDYSFQLVDAPNTTAFWATWSNNIGAPFSLQGQNIGGGGTGGTNPVPLPAAGWLMLAGIGALAGFRSRRKST